MIRRTGAAAAQNTAELTPMMKQYFAAKEQHPHDIVFFRMGDFYEMFFDDAVAVSELLGIALTSRSKDKSGEKVPMAGIPVKSVDAYTRKLLEAGRRVAICEQLQDASEVKGIVDRGVVRVITPGTFFEGEHLDDHRALHLAAVVQSEDGLGVSWVDLSTGKFFAEDLANEKAWEEALLRIGPVECLYPEGLRPESFSPLAWLTESFPKCALTPFPEWHFDGSTGRQRLLAHFGTQTLEGFGCEHLGAGLQAAGALIHYLRETQRQALSHITRLVPGQSGRFMRLDAATHRALDLIEVARTGDRRGSLLWLLDKTKTAMGARQLREWLCSPLLDRDEILRRQNAVKVLVEDDDRRKTIRRSLGQVRDIERLVSRLPMGRVNGRDLRALHNSLAAVPELLETLDGVESRELEGVRRALEIDALPEIAGQIDRAIVDEPPMTIKEGGVIRDGFEPELDELRVVSTEGVNWIAQFQEQEAERTGIPNLKVGYNRVFGYYIEVTNAHRDKAPEEYVRKQTLKNAERYITPKLKEQENRVLGAKERAEKLEYEVFQKLRAEIEEHLPLLQDVASALARLDAITSLSTIAHDEGYVAPEIVETPILDVVDGLHPVVASGHAKANFTPNDIKLGGEDARLGVITGPNMAGKSTYIRQAALITILAQIGSFVPAQSARVGIADRIFTRVGAADDLARGQSTFMVEMTETANILNNATERSLVILDEVGRGTSTLDGVSLAWAIAEHLVTASKARALFATHYHELTDLEDRFEGAVCNLNVSVKEWQDEIVFLHKIVPGGTDKAYGIHVARLAGIPENVLDRAKSILAHLESEHAGSQHVPDAPATPQPSTENEGGQQLDLFGNAYDGIDRKLRALSVDETTPIDALLLLRELKRLLP